ncbi:MAG: GNAT family N-acetyltransferase [Aestuariibaculum sp.]
MIIKVDSTITLRQFTLTDATDIFSAIDTQRQYLGKWLPFVAYTKQLLDTEVFVKSVVNAPKDKFEYVFTIRIQDEFVGVIGFKDTDWRNRKTEIGYWLSKKFQKQGIMTKCVAQLCNFAFNEQNLNRVKIKCAVQNQPSINIPKRLGFTFEGTERQGELLAEGFTDLVIYSKLKSD